MGHHVQDGASRMRGDVLSKVVDDTVTWPDVVVVSVLILAIAGVLIAGIMKD